MDTWRRFIEAELSQHGEAFNDIVAIAGTDDFDLDNEFEAGVGGNVSGRFTIWTKRRVYFPLTYDGAAGIASVPRDPCDEATEPIG